MSRVAAPPLCPYSSPASEAPYVHLRLPLTPLPSRGCVTAWGADGAHPAAPGLPSTVCAAALAPHTRATPVLALPSPPPPPPGSTGTTCTPRCTCWTRGSGRSSTPSSSSSWRGPHAWRRDPCLAGERRQHRNDEQAGRNHCRRLELVFCLFFFSLGRCRRGVGLGEAGDDGLLLASAFSSRLLPRLGFLECAVRLDWPSSGSVGTRCEGCISSSIPARRPKSKGREGAVRHPLQQPVHAALHKGCQKQRARRQNSPPHDPSKTWKKETIKPQERQPPQHNTTHETPSAPPSSPHTAM